MKKQVKRGCVMVNGKRYFSAGLINFEGEIVFIKVESEQAVRVFNASGALICTAKIEAYKRSNVPKSFNECVRSDQIL